MEENTPEVPETPDLTAFTSVADFDAHIEALAAEPTVANLALHAEAIAAKAEYEAAVAQVEAAQEAAEAAVVAEAEQIVAEETEVVETETEAEVVEITPVEEPVVEANPELIAAAVATGTATVDTESQTPTGPPARTRKAALQHVIGHSRADVRDTAHMEELMRAAVKKGGDATVFEFPVYDRAAVGEDNILKADNKASDNDRILGLTDAEGNRLEGIRDFRSASIHKAGMGSRVHRASCGGCGDCDNVLESPDCFADYGEPLGDCFDAVPADTCSWNVEKQKTLADLDQEVYAYCGVDAEGNPAAGIVDTKAEPSESGLPVVIPIKADDPTTWKKYYEIKTECGDKTKYGLEEFPLLITVDRNVDFCSKPGQVARTLNRYFALQSRFMEARKKAILRAYGLDNGFAGAVAAPSGVGLEFDFSALLTTVSGAIEARTGVGSLEGHKLAVPAGMGTWVNCSDAGLIGRLADKFGLTGIVECGGDTSPYNDAAYDLAAGTKLAVEPLAEALKTWEFVAFDPTQWRKPVAETVSIGVRDTFRDWDLARQNKRGIVIYRDETLIPVGCVPSVCLDGTFCNLPVDPARSAIDACA